MIEGLNNLDKSLFLFLNAFHANWLDPVMVFLSGQLVWVPFVGYFIWLAFRSLDRKKAWLFVLFLVLAIIASDVTSSYMLKNLVTRFRPCRDLDLKPLIYSFGQRCGGKFGFVSSHAANSFALVIFSLKALNIRKNLMLGLVLLPLIVSYSRVYLGVHYPGDILGGAVVGVWWGWFLSWVFRETQGANRESAH